ncbi:MAG: CHAT domain-containing protein [Pyrinomonadaceae bacterium]
METTKFRDYFLGKLSPSEAEALEIEIISNAEIEAELQVAESALNEDYLDETLNSEDKTAFEQNYLITKSRREQVDIIRQLKILSQKTPVAEAKPSFLEQLKASFRLHQLALGFGSLALVLIIGYSGYFVWKNYNTQSEVLVALNNYQKDARPLESRISDFNYAPKTEGTRGDNQAKDDELDFADLNARNLVRQNQTAENLHELGRVYLTRKKFDEAIEQFEKAIKLNANHAKLHNDLGVALMEKGSLNKTNVGKLDNKADEPKPYLELFAKANEEFAKAIELDKNLLEAHFNRALCISHLDVLPNQAKEAWENYLKLDSNSEWADEARERLKKLELNRTVSKTKEEILKEFLEAKEANDTEKAWQIVSKNRELSSGKLIPLQLAFLFVESKTNGNENKAREVLEALSYVGKLEQEKGGDLFWRDLASYYLENLGDKITNLRNAQNLVKKAMVLRVEGDFEQSLIDFEDAKEIFIANHNTVEEKICDYWIGVVVYQLSEIERSNRIYHTLVRFSETRNYKWLATHSYIRLTYGVSSQNQYSKSIEYSQKALSFARQTNDAFNLQRIYSSLSYDYKSLGQIKRSLQLIEKGLILATPDVSYEQKLGVFESVTTVLLEDRKEITAILFQREAMSLAEDAKDILEAQLSAIYLGMLYANINRPSESEDFFQLSLKKAESIESEKARNKALAYSNLRYANLKQKTGDCQEAVSLYNLSLNYYSSLEFQLHIYEANKGKLICHFLNKNDPEIQRELPILLEIFAKYRKEILEEQNRDSFFDNGQDVYDIATEFEFDRSNFAKSFDYAEESRSRSLLDLQNSMGQVSLEEAQPEIKFSAKFSEPLKISQIQKQIPENAQLLVYSVLPEKVLVWTVTQDLLSSTKIEIRLEQLEEQVKQYLELVSKQGEMNEHLALSKELYRKLILPIANKLDPHKQLFIVPDKILFHLPFATLYSDKYLVEDFNISYSPSASIFVNSTKRANGFKDKKTESILSIGNPAFDQVEYENTLQRLPSAKDEAKEVAQQYEKLTVLTEDLATKKSIKALLKDIDIFHFAGHYVIDERNPLLSSLILAGDKKAESNLANYEVIGEKLFRTRLIVLSACQTAIEKYYKGEGLVGASRTFLATNVPLVVASQWAVDSEATRDLMVRFHQYRKTKHITTAEALRQSQIEMLKHEKYQQPYYWAAFAPIGGYTEF